ncbi:MAG: hypothetical protein ACJ0F0_03535 [Burkholderiaceae bacterium]
MLTLHPTIRDLLNLRIENKPELWDTLKNFHNTLIHIGFIDYPFKSCLLVLRIDADGLLKSSEIKNINQLDDEAFENTTQTPDIVIRINNKYLNNIGNEFVGWAFDFSKEDFPDADVFTNGLIIEGDAGTIQELAPLLKIILDDLSPIATFVKKSPVNYATNNFFEYILKKERTIVLKDDFEIFVKHIRGLRNGIERSEKRLENLVNNF